MRTLLLAVTLLTAGIAAAGTSPGGRFSERLNQARKKSRPAAVPRVTVRTVTEAPAPAPRPGVRRKRTGRRAAAPRPAAKAARTPRWQFRATGIEKVSFHVGPRAAGAEGDPKTGDLRLIAEPPGARVYYYIKGGSQLPGTGTVELKGQKPPAGGKRFYVLAVAPDLGGRAPAYVPVKPGHVTTVRFRFEGAPSTAAPDKEPVRIQIVEPD